MFTFNSYLIFILYSHNRCLFFNRIIKAPFLIFLTNCIILFFLKVDLHWNDRSIVKWILNTVSTPAILWLSTSRIHPFVNLRLLHEWLLVLIVLRLSNRYAHFILGGNCVVWIYFDSWPSRAYSHIIFFQFIFKLCRTALHFMIFVYFI